jgi:membrane protein DedA with SNARE-associated domain
MLDSAFHLLSQSPEAYLIVFALCLGDAILPALPSEASLIVAGLLCVDGTLSLPWVIGAGATGAFLGDTGSYSIGRWGAKPLQQRFLNGKRARKAVEWARAQLSRHGGAAIAAGRFVPGGRTGVTLACGITHYRYARFAAFDAGGVVTWAAYGALLGYAGGRFFREHAWVALLVALGVAVVISSAVEGVRRLRARA